MRDYVAVSEGLSHDLHCFYGVPVEVLKRTFNKIQDPDNWKNPLTCFCHHSQARYVIAAIAFYHGAEAELSGPVSLTGEVMISSPGYQCD